LKHQAFCNRLGLRHPIVQAPIGGASTVELVASVCNAGGMGVLSGTWREPVELERMVSRIRALTDRPFGVNFVLEWDMRERVRICLDAGVKHFSFFWGDPAAYIDDIHRSGGTVWCTVSDPAVVRERCGAGVDVLVAQGWEAGGHVEGALSTMALVPRVVDFAQGVPVLAAGGIADGRGIAAALCLGAAGAWIGTAFLAAEEACVHPAYQDRLFQSEGIDTVHTELFDGGWPKAPHRVLRNSDWVAWKQAGAPDPGSRPGEGMVIGHDPEGDPVVRYTSHLPRPGGTGDILNQALYSGQGVGLVRRLQPASEIVGAMASQLAETLAGLDASRGDR